MKPLLTCREAAGILRVHEHQLYKMAAERQIGSVKLPGLGLRFVEEDLEHWINDGRREIEMRPKRRSCRKS